MRILHTSDWHLGKSLEGFSRLEEQEQFVDEFIDIVNKNSIDLVIISGDIYDSGNPPARAESLFYKALKGIESKDRAVFIIAGNHDNPERLTAVSPITLDKGIIILGTPESRIFSGCSMVKDSGPCYVELEIKGERVVIAALPYPSEKRLNDIWNKGNEDEKESQKSYDEKIGEIFRNLEKKFRRDTINIAVSHIFMTGGDVSDSERPIELGGSLAVSYKSLPKKAQYIALGHLHKPQKVKGGKLNAYYSGSPLQYSRSEIGYSKGCYIVDVKAGEEAKVNQVFFRNYKPIEVWKCESTAEAIERCRENSKKNVWVYIEIKTDKYISQEDIKEMKELKSDIIEIRPVIEGQEEKDEGYEDFKEKSMKELFKDFYLSERGVEPEEEVLDAFLKIAGESDGEGDEDETALS